MEEKAIEIMSKISKVSVEELHGNMNTVKLWDSISHVEIILTIESEFGVSFDENDIAQMTTPNKFLNFLSEKINKK